MNNFVRVCTFELDSKADSKKGNHHQRDRETWEDAVIVYFVLSRATHVSLWKQMCHDVLFCLFFFFQCGNDSQAEPHYNKYKRDFTICQNTTKTCNTELSVLA